MIKIRLFVWLIQHWLAWAAAFALALLIERFAPITFGDELFVICVSFIVPGIVFSFVQEELKRRREDKSKVGRS